MIICFWSFWSQSASHDQTRACPQDGETSVVAVTGMVCLGNAHWAAMVWPLQAQEDWACIAPAPAGQSCFVHICKCKDWNVIPVNAVWSHGRAMLQRTEVKEPLGQYLLLNRRGERSQAAWILTSLAHHFGNGDESYVSSVMAAWMMMKRKMPLRHLLLSCLK